MYIQINILDNCILKIPNWNLIDIILISGEDSNKWLEKLHKHMLACVIKRTTSNWKIEYQLASEFGVIVRSKRKDCIQKIKLTNLVLFALHSFLFYKYQNIRIKTKPKRNYRPYKMTL